MAKIQFEVTDDAGVKVISKISGVPATAGLDSLTQFMATQVVVTPGVNGGPPVSKPMYTDAADFAKKNFMAVIRQISPNHPSSHTKADVDEIEAKIAALKAKRDALFAAAEAEK